jgi:hypothetical protein
MTSTLGVLVASKLNIKDFDTSAKPCECLINCSEDTAVASLTGGNFDLEHMLFSIG